MIMANFAAFYHIGDRQQAAKKSHKEMIKETSCFKKNYLNLSKNE